MKKLFFPFKVCLLTLIVGAALFGFSYTQAAEPVFNESTSYEMVSKGYLTNPKQTKEGVIVTNNRHSEVYLVENGQLNTILSGPGSGRYTNLNKEKTLLGFKSINEEGLQAPAILDLKTRTVTLLENYSQQCGQVSFANDGTIAYAVGDVLYIKRGNIKQEYPLGYYVNIVNISPDASQVAFSDPDGKTIILNLQTRIRRQVTESGQFNPVWSPDGRKLAIEGRAHAVSVYDLNQNRVFDLGSGFEPTWLENSNELVFSSPHYKDGDVFKYEGTSIRQVSFDGRVEREIMPISHEAPGEIAILDNGKIVVPFTNGNRRLSVIDLPKLNQQGSRIKAAQTEEVLVFIPKDQDFGRRLMFTKPSFEELEKMEANGPLKAPQAINGGTIGLTAIPYVNQVWDVPASDYGCTGYGYVACAPTTSCMLLGYYGLIPKVAVTSRASGVGTVYYSWQVGRQYTSSNTNYTFSLAATGNGCTAKGGYGYMWNGGSPASKMRNFYVNNGVPSGSTAYDYTGLTKIRTETNANRPYSFCVTSSKTSGHLILVFRSDQKAVKVNGVWTPQASTGSIIVHDPYGDANNSSWPNWDGRYSTYDYQGYNNGYLKMNNAWGVTVNYSTAPVKNPTITPSSTSLSFGSVNVNATKSLTFTVSTKDLSANVSVSSNSSAFTVSPTSLGTGGGTVTVTFKPTAEQSYSGTLTLSSTGATSKTVSLSGSGTKPRISLTEKMNISQTKSNTTSKGWNSTLVRNMAYASGKLYLVYEHNTIKVVKSQSGDFLYDLDKTSINGGTLTLCDVGVFDGKVIACNLAEPKTGALKIYAWNNDQSAPTVVLNTTNLGGAPRLGDVMEFTGNWNSGKISFAHDDGVVTRIVNYAVSNGTISASPTVIEAKKDGKRLACSSSIRVQPDANGYWINGKENALTRLNAQGVYQYEMPQSNTHGNGFSAFTYDGISYAVATTFMSTTNYVGGAMQLMDASPGWAGATLVGSYPYAGLGTTPNSGCTGGCIARAGSNYVEAWVLSTSQGIAYYTYGTPPTHTYQTTSLTVSPASLAFGNVITGQTKAMTFNVTGTMLTANSTVSSNSAAFTVSPASLGTSGGTVTVTFKPTAKQAYSGTITVTNGSLTKTVALTGAGIDDPATAKVISVSPASLNMSCSYDKTVTANFTVTGSNLTTNIAVASSNASVFAISPTSLPATGGTVTVTFKPSAQTSYTGTITLTATGADNKTVAVTGTGQALGAISLTEKWNHSTKKGNATAESWDATKVRNLAYGNNGKLYLVYDHADIKVVESQTGKFLYDLDKTNVSGGALTFCDVAFFDGKAVAGNLATTTALKVYVWDTDSSTPRVLLETTNLGGATRAGDNIAFSGTWASGKLSVPYKDDTKSFILNYAITNGVVATTPTKVEATTNGTSPLTYTSTIRVQPDASGYWINGKGNKLTRLDASGKQQYQVAQDNALGTGFTVFQYHGANYAVASTFVGSGNYIGGAMELIEGGSSWATPAVKGTYPSAGLGDTANTNCTGHALAVSGTGYIESWVLSTLQGIAYYTYGTPPTYTFNETPTLNVSPASLAFGNIDNGQTKAMSFTVTGTKLSGNISVSSNSTAFTVSTASLAATGGTVTVTFKPTAVQSYSGTITVSGGGLSKTVAVSGAGINNEPVVKEIGVSPASLSLSCPVDQTKTASFTVTGENLTGDISVSSNVSAFTVTPKTLSKTGGVVTVTFNPSEVKTYNGTITLSSSGATNKTVAVTGTGQALSGITFTEGWNQSEVKGNANSNSWNAANTNIRNMAYGNNGKLYLVYEGNIIKVVESQTGKFVGDMSGEGITGGWPALSDVHYFDGKVIACNLRTATSHSLKIYVWDGEKSKPRVLLETTNVGGLTRIGDNMGLQGSWMDGKISFATTENSVTTIVNYKITNGVVATTPTTLTATAGGNPLVYTSTVRVQPDATGYYINGKGGNLTRLNTSGVKQYELSQTNKIHNGATVFSYYGTNYAVAGTFLEGNYKKGVMQLYNVGNDWSSASLVGTYPSAGLGTTDNTNGTGHAIAATSDSSIELWVLSTNQGIAYYKYGTPPNFGAVTLQTGEGTLSDAAGLCKLYVNNNTLYVKGVDAERVELYSLSGTRVLSVENQNEIDLPSMSSGVYIAVLTTSEGVIRREKIMVK